MAFDMAATAPAHLEPVAVSVLVPVLNEERHIRETVAAMQAQRMDGNVEFLFADGGSSDRTREILDELAAADPRIRVFANPRRSTPSGLNVCLRHARGQYVARMDAHTFYPDTYLADGVVRLSRGDTSWVSGPAIPHPIGRVSGAVALALGTRLGQGGSRKWSAEGDAHDTDDEVELDTGVFAGVWRRERVIAAGGWDERWRANQDAEMAARFHRAGERLVCVRSMGARYIPRDSLPSLARQYHRYGYYRARTARRHPESMRRSHLIAPALVITTATAIIGPGRVGRTSRLALASYTVAIAATGVRTAARGGVAEAATISAAFAAIHYGHGTGFLHGALTFGVPWLALLRLAGLRALALRLERDAEPVYAPSLEADAGARPVG